MPHYLTIDQGNSEAKMALWEDRTLADTAIEPNLTPAVVARFVGDRALSGAIYCTVVHNNGPVVNKLSHLSRCVYRLTASTPLPIKIDYEMPKTLGADRIAAAVGAWAQHPGQNLLVIDAGTAVTYDYVDSTGVYRGGNIAPGISMELRALHEFTARLPQVAFPQDIPSFAEQPFGRNTHDAIARGTVLSVVASIEYYRNQLPKSTITVLGGGCARHLAQLCSFPVEVDEHLASRGLNRILLYNEFNEI